MSKIITDKHKQVLENLDNIFDVINYLNEIKSNENYSDEEMENDLEVALWRSYVYNNMDEYKYYALSEKVLKKVKQKGEKSGLWCYRYSCALMYLRKFDEALKYSILGTEIEPEYPWGWLQLARLYYKFKKIDEAYKSIENGLKLVPNDYEFLTLKDDIANKRSFGIAVSHYIYEEDDKDETNDTRLDIEDEEKWKEFKKSYDKMNRKCN